MPLLKKYFDVSSWWGNKDKGSASTQPTQPTQPKPQPFKEINPYPRPGSDDQTLWVGGRVIPNTYSKSTTGITIEPLHPSIVVPKYIKDYIDNINKNYPGFPVRWSVFESNPRKAAIALHKENEPYKFGVGMDYRDKSVSAPAWYAGAPVEYDPDTDRMNVYHPRLDNEDPGARYFSHFIRNDGWFSPTDYARTFYTSPALAPTQLVSAGANDLRGLHHELIHSAVNIARGGTEKDTEFRDAEIVGNQMIPGPKGIRELEFLPTATPLRPTDPALPDYYLDNFKDGNAATRKVYVDPTFDTGARSYPSNKFPHFTTWDLWYDMIPRENHNYSRTVSDRDATYDFLAQGAGLKLPKHSLYPSEPTAPTSALTYKEPGRWWWPFGSRTDHDQKLRNAGLTFSEDKRVAQPDHRLDFYNLHDIQGPIYLQKAFRTGTTPYDLGYKPMEAASEYLNNYDEYSKNRAEVQRRLKEYPLTPELADTLNKWGIEPTFSEHTPLNVMPIRDMKQLSKELDEGRETTKKREYMRDQPEHNKYNRPVPGFVPGGTLNPSMNWA